MPYYDLDRLGDGEFEQLVQSLLKKIIGEGTITFGEGPDGGREATYSGSAPYPSRKQNWKGKWIFQAKFHNVRRIGAEKARKELVKDLKSELQKITKKYKRECDNYILATNVPLSSVAGIGTHDKIAEQIAPEYAEDISNIHVWGYDEIARFLDEHGDVRQTYLHLITPGDLIAELMDRNRAKKSDLGQTIRLYVHTSFEREQYAQLDQAGEINEQPVQLRRVFVDLNVRPRTRRDVHAWLEGKARRASWLGRVSDEQGSSVTEILVNGDINRIVLIGGPGQGKSTLGQYVAQIHRAYVLGRHEEINGDAGRLIPSLVRVPFRVALKDYAQAIADSKDALVLEEFLAQLVRDQAGRAVDSREIQDIIKRNPTLLILDGLDEVTDRMLRTRMLNEVSGFIGRCEDVLEADLQVVATSRPTGYSDQFDPSRFLHLELITMNNDKVVEYVQRWIRAKNMERTKADSLRATVRDCLEDSQFCALMTTPLQVTIFILIILSGGTPPRQREELFNEYLEVIYKRERAKSKTIIRTEKRLLFGLHQYMGYLLHRSASESTETRSRMKEEDFGKEVLRYLRHEDPYSELEELKREADRILTEARERLVLLVELERGFFGFELRSLQEFFAAGYLVESAGGSDQRFARFLAIGLPPHWRNVALFFAGRVSRCYRGEAAHILESCREIDRHPPDRYIRRGAWLALDIAVDRSFGPSRMLQRSAVEIALSLLDSDIDRGHRSQIVAALRRLPEEDLRDHVLPLLSERVAGEEMWRAYYAAEIFSELSPEAKEALGPVLERGFNQANVIPEELLERAIRYGIDADAIQRAAECSALGFSEGGIISHLVRWFGNRPSYVSRVLEKLGFKAEVASELFDRALENGAFLREPIADDISSEWTSPIDQVGLAGELAKIVGEFRRRARPFAYDEFALQYSKHAVRESVVSTGGPSDDLLGDALTSKVVPQLRATGGALLMIEAVARQDNDQLAHIMKRLASTGDNAEIEAIERILCYLGAPSTDMADAVLRASTARRGLWLGEGARNMWLSSSDSKSKARAETLLLMLVVEALESTDASEIVGMQRRRRFFGEEDDFLFGRAMVRMGGVVLTREPLLSKLAVARTLKAITHLIRKQGSDDWRAWYTLRRLGSFGWRRQQHGHSELEGELTSLLLALRERTPTLGGKWEICGLITRCAHLGIRQTMLVDLLSLVGSIPEGRIPDRYSHSAYLGWLSQKRFQALLDISLAVGGCAWDGYLRWFAIAARDLAHGRLRGVEKGLDLNVDYAVVEGSLREPGLAREGAILLLGSMRGITEQQAEYALVKSMGDRKPVDRAWALSLKWIAEKRSLKDRGRVLERILIEGAKFPRAVRYAALERYEMDVKRSARDIRDREGSLGLPFQDPATV